MRAKQFLCFDQKELKCHMKIIKWTGVIGIILVSLSTPLYVLASK